MFSNLPKLTAPFGLLGDNAKLAFRTQPSGIRKLSEVKNISDTDTYWDQYVLLFDSPSDVFSLISSQDIRHAIVESPKNVATLVRVLSQRLFTLLLDHTFPTAPASSVASYATNFLKNMPVPGSTSTAERNTTKEALNCLRVLQRVLPVVFEAEYAEFEQALLWTQGEAKDAVVAEDGQQSQFVIEDDEDDDLEAQQSPRATARTGETRMLPSLAERLLRTTIDLLFCCGFTLPSRIQVDHHKINYVIWEKGVGSTVDPSPSNAHDSNKVEVLRFLLVLLSRQIYVSPSSLLSTPSPYTLNFVQKSHRRHVLTVLCSLLNTAMNSSHQSTGVVAVAGKLPYNHLMFKGEDPRVTLVGICLQVLSVLLDFQSGSAGDVVSNSVDPPATAPTSKTNAFRYFLAKLHRPADFEFILDGLLGILQQHMWSINNLLPGSQKPVPHILETIVFFWKVVELNKKFRSYVLDSDKGSDMLAYLLCYGMDVKDKPQQHGLCRALSYIIQTLSAERAFGEKLSSPIRLQLPAKWSSGGTVGDFMINSIYSIVATTSGQLNSLYPALIIALSNSAPFFKHLTVVASNRLVQLFAAFSSPSFLLSDEGHPRLLFFMTEVFNGIILHHLDENPNLAYAVLRSHKTFEDMGTFTLARGLREIRRIQKAKEELAQKKSQGSAVTKDDPPDGQPEHPHEEKARLLRSETRGSLSHAGRESQEQLQHAASPPNVESSEDPVQSDENAPVPIVTSPTASETQLPSGTPAANLSEKARGKMRQRQRSMSLDTTSSLERIAAAGIGRNGFVPTQEWVTSWQQGLPLDPILLTISELLPKIHELQASLNKANTTPAIIDFLRSSSLQHVLPPHGPWIPRRFQWTDSSIIWLSSLIWGEIYVRGMTPLGIWNFTNVRLFYVKHTQSQQRQISEAVSNVVGGLPGLGGFLGRSNLAGQNTPPRTPR
ncbi:hypothetical protein BD410DRAFT_835524 [Rickenella mellea]|uniref:High-temperature-induced dauer-formation protein n=1 Tax=Rickenella mellea TaxID=50990 RepID=A0A4Y7QIY4_9AGAM|nr:hypothetical protein BD410DRAFT_835524 [Rickenella mellea]